MLVMWHGEAMFYQEHAWLGFAILQLLCADNLCRVIHMNSCHCMGMYLQLQSGITFIQYEKRKNV